VLCFRYIKLCTEHRSQYKNQNLLPLKQIKMNISRIGT